MSAFNVVRFRVKPGREEEFLEAHRRIREEPEGFRRGTVVQTGEHAYCFIGEWDGFEDIAAARTWMIGILDTFRDTLEDLGSGLGVTDPVSGTAVVDIVGTAERRVA